MRSKGGLVVDEGPPKTQGHPRNFPKRNRMGSALSKGVVVIEAEKKSGSLITARLALEQGRDLFAMINQSEGCKELIAKGYATPINEAEDIFSYYYSMFRPKEEKTLKKQSLSQDDLEILKYISLGNDKNQISERLMLDAKDLTRRLNFLEIKGYIAKTGHLKYEIIRKG